MPCPRCGEPLLAREAEGTSYHACGAHGDYVSHDALRRALPFAAHSALEEARERATPGSALCPSCGAAMGVATLVRHGDAIELDVCHACGGCWFDTEELSRARAAPKGTGAVGHAAPRHARAFSAGSQGAALVAVDPVAWVSLVEFLRGLLE